VGDTWRKKEETHELKGFIDKGLNLFFFVIKSVLVPKSGDAEQESVPAYPRWGRGFAVGFSN